MSSDLDLQDALRGYLAAATGSPVDIVLRRTYEEITSLVVTGAVDAAWICGYPYVEHASALELLAAPVWRGRPLYQSYVIVGDGRPEPADLAGLRGDVHAFSDPKSNSGFLVTAAALAEIGATPEGFFGRPFFTYSHVNVVRAVATGLADSGSVDGYIWEVLAGSDPELTRQTRIVRRSEWLGFPPLVAPARPVHAGAPEAIRAAFAGMPGDALGRQVLSLLRLDGFASVQPGLYDAIAAKATALGRMG